MEVSRKDCAFLLVFSGAYLHFPFFVYSVQEIGANKRDAGGRGRDKMGSGWHPMSLFSSIKDGSESPKQNETTPNFVVQLVPEREHGSHLSNELIPHRLVPD